MKPSVLIEYCPRCNWLLRAAYMAQELLSTFSDELEVVSLKPSPTNGHFSIKVEGELVFDRKDYGGFPEIKEVKQWVRDKVAPFRDLGHADTKSHHS